MKVLIVGGSGYVGTHMARHLLEQGHQVTIASRRGEGPLPGVQDVMDDMLETNKQWLPQFK